jgi:hypothetical protein
MLSRSRSVKKVPLFTSINKITYTLILRVDVNNVIEFHNYKATQDFPINYKVY